MKDAHVGQVDAPRRALSVFASLSIRNFRLYLIGMNVAFIGMWMLRVAQGWLALQLTGSGTALGLVTACMYLPTVLVGTFSGVLADRYPKRNIVYATTGGMGITALALGALEISGHLRLWQLFTLVTIFGVLSAVDTPTRLSFVVEMVGPKSLTNAVALNSASVNAARLVGPAIAGVLIALVGTGWVILIYAAAAATAIVFIAQIRAADLHTTPPVPRQRGQFREGVSYVREHAALRRVFVTMLVVGTFGMTQETLLPLATSHVFNRGAGVYGMLAAAVAVGTLGGALAAAWRGVATPALLTFSAAGLGATWLLVAVMPSVPFVAAVLPVMGLCQIAAITTANSIVQLAVDPGMRGRVMALYLTALLGGAPLGAPLVGTIAEAWGTRQACGLAGVLTIVGALVGLRAGARRSRSTDRADSGRDTDSRGQGESHRSRPTASR